MNYSLAAPEVGNMVAVIVTYNPDMDFRARVGSIRGQVARILVVDNGSSDEVLLCLKHLESEGEIDVILNRENLGIAAALNQGMAWARNNGFHWVLTLDHDSTLYPGMTMVLSEICSESGLGNIALVGAGYENANTGLRHQGEERFGDIKWREVKVNITSGSLMSLRAYIEIGPFREDFFIDSVDQEYCLRARAKGYRILVSCNPLMTHALGDYSEVCIFGRRVAYTNHSPVRRYYSTRNRLVLMREYFGSETAWVADLFRRFVQDALMVILFEKSKIRKFRAIGTGVLDFALGRMGRLN